MELLFDKKHRHTDFFTYQINRGGELNVKECGTVAIRFVDGKFADVEFPFKGPYTRNGWRILAAIEAEITRLEGEMGEHKSPKTGYMGNINGLGCEPDVMP